jgi:hypothetical protein
VFVLIEKSSPIIHNTNGRQSISASAKDLLLVLAAAWILAGYIWAAASRADIKTRFCRTAQRWKNHIIPCVRRIYSLFFQANQLEAAAAPAAFITFKLSEVGGKCALRVCGIRVNLYSGRAQRCILK